MIHIYHVFRKYYGNMFFIHVYFALEKYPDELEENRNYSSRVIEKN